MKKNIQSLMAMLMVSTVAMSQGFYTEVNTGYGFPFVGSVVGTDYESVSSSSPMSSIHTVDYTLVKGSYGQGVNFGLEAGYMFTSNFGVSLGANYLLGRQYTSTYLYTDSYSDPSWGSYYYSEEQKRQQQAEMLRLIPSFILATNGEKIKPYAKLGLVLGVMNKVDITNEYWNTEGDREDFTAVFNGGLGIGLNTEFGVDFKLSELLSITGGVNAISMSYAPTKGELLSYKINGVEQIGTMTTRDKEVLFLDDISYNTNIPPNENEPSEQLKEYMPFSSLGIKVGLRFNL